MEKVIETMTPKGTALTITLRGEDWPQQSIATATIRGTTYRLNSYGDGRIAYLLDSPREGATHYLSAYSPKASIGLGAEAVAAINAGDAAFRATLAAMPGHTMARLISQRESLNASISGILAEIAEQRERAYNRDVGPIPSYDSHEYRQAVAALAAWDEAHPDVVAEIARRREEDIKRHQWD